MDCPVDSNSDSVPYQPLFNNDQTPFGDTERDCLMGAEEHEMPPVENFVTTPRKEARWTHISDLDDFFARVYEYYQRHGFICMVLEDMLQIIFLWYVVTFSLFVGVAVDYKVLFQEGYNQSIKVTLSDAILPWSEIQHSFNAPLIILLGVTTLYLLFRSQKALFNVAKYWEMRMFFRDGLKIRPRDLPDKTWRDVQSRLIELQSRIQMCLHKNEISELDVCHRILRFKNYIIGMVNKSVLPMKYQVPFIGESIFFTSGLKYNFEMILFWGPGAPFKNSWQLKSKYKQFAKKEEAAAELSKRIFLFGCVNFVMIPFICIWTVLYFFFENFALFRNDPSLLGSRTWSLYGKYYLRHYNELNHDFHTRLNKGYRAAVKYMGLFWSPLLAIISKFLMSICSGFLVFLLACTVADEDTLAVKGMIGIITVLGIIVTLAKNLVPDENMVKMPESLMNNILCHIHYVPDDWRGHAHALRVQKEFSQLFQYKIVYLINEMLSPVLAPFILWFWLRPRSLMIVNFLRNNTVSLNGLGDVCVFAHLDFRKTGYYNINMRNRHHPPPTDSDLSSMNFKAMEEFGGNVTELKKMELSLLNFTLANPEWKIPEAENEVLSHIKENVNAMKRDMGVFNPSAQDNPLYTSSQVLSMLSQPGYHSMTMSALPKSQFRMSGISQKSECEVPPTPPGAEGSATEAPVEAASSASDPIQTWKTQTNGPNPQIMVCSSGTTSRGPSNEAVVEMMANEMSYSALYFHGTYRNKKPTDLPTTSQTTPDDFPGNVDSKDEELHLARYFQRRSQELFSAESPKELLRLSNIEEEEELVRQADNSKFEV